MRGRKDWGTSAPIEGVYKVDDLAEAVVRLGSPVSYYRGATVILIDDFEDNVNKWRQEKTGVGAEIVLSTDTARNGGKSVKLKTGDATGNYARILRFFCPTNPVRVGTEISAAVASIYAHFDMELQFRNGSLEHIAAVRYHHPDQTLSYYDDTGSWVTFATATTFARDPRSWTTFKLVVDFDKQRYVRFLANEKEFDLSEYSYYKSPQTGATYLRIVYQLTSTASGGWYWYLDDFMLRQNEP